MITRVKICGITSSADAHVAVDAGASAIGFIFVPSSPRFIDAGTARSIIRDIPLFVTPVGVVTDATPSDAAALISRTGIRALQLHGGDSTGFDDLPVPTYRVYRVSDTFDPEVLRSAMGGTFMLDTYKEGMPGGTGRAFDWGIAVKARTYGRLILSGGLNPENVGDAIRRVAPYAIDVNSGVEASPGRKDHGKIRKLFDAIRKADNEGEESCSSS